MYRLISSSLLVLLVVSVAFAHIGLIGYSPEGILLTAVVAVGSTLVATMMFAQTVKTIAHLESSLITGLLITFIVPPTTLLHDVGGAAAAGALAGASKFLLVYQARHFLNPAAVGLTITSLLGVTASFWWVATPPLTPLILILGGLIAWRSGFWSVALTGLVVGVLATMVRLLMSGQDPLGSLYLVMTSYPIVFLALFMLTEPLTLPGRHRARMLVAVVVGLGVALPFSVPLWSYTLYSSPELALVLGNLVAFGASLASYSSRSVGVSLLSTETSGGDHAVFRFGLDKPLRFRAGQWVEIHFPHRAGDRRGQRRVFSVASKPQDALSASPTLEVWTRLSHPGSSLKHALALAPPTSGARISRVGGDFTLPLDPTTPLLLIAGGVGITPFASQLAELVHREMRADIVLVEVRSNPEDAWCDDLIAEAGARHLITDRAGLAEVLETQVGDASERWCAVSGSPSFVTFSTRALRQVGVKRVAQDSFIGY
jgi:glycine betaine catabolism B